MPKTKQILVRVSEDEHRALAAKAKVAGVSIPFLIRDQIDRVHATENSNHVRLEKLLLVRIGIQMDRMAEQCGGQNDKLAVLEILARLIGIERELRSWNQDHRKA